MHFDSSTLYIQLHPIDNVIRVNKIPFIIIIRQLAVTYIKMTDDSVETAGKIDVSPRYIWLDVSFQTYYENTFVVKNMTRTISYHRRLKMQSYFNNKLQHCRYCCAILHILGFLSKIASKRNDLRITLGESCRMFSFIRIRHHVMEWHYREC